MEISSREKLGEIIIDFLMLSQSFLDARNLSYLSNDPFLSVHFATTIKLPGTSFHDMINSSDAGVNFISFSASV